MKLRLLALASLLTLMGCGPDYNCNDGTTVFVYNPSPYWPIAYAMSGSGFNPDDTLLLDTIYPETSVSWHTNNVPYENNLFSSTTSSMYFYLQTVDGIRSFKIEECETMIEAVEGWIVEVEPCVNGEHDASNGEEGIDCGGSCAPCDSAACELPNGKFVSSTFGNYNFDQYYDGFSNSISPRYYVGFNSDYYMYITFNIENMPKYNKVFETGQSFGKVDIDFITGSTNERTPEGGQELFLTYLGDNEYTLEFCDLKFLFGQQEVIFSGHLNLRP